MTKSLFVFAALLGTTPVFAGIYDDPDPAGGDGAKVYDNCANPLLLTDDPEPVGDVYGCSLSYELHETATIQLAAPKPTR